MHKIFAVLIAMTMPSPVFAQQVDRQREEEHKQKISTQERVLKAAEEAQKAAVGEPFEPVSYADVMKDPDNIELNFRYARTLVAKGENLKAAATLERILMVNPELPRVRLFYASILFRLDNLDDAEREFKVLTKQQLTPTMKEELEGYVKQIKQRRRKTRVGLTVMTGLDFDENRNSAPSGMLRLAADVPTILDGASTRKNDTSKTMSAAANVSHDLGYQAGHSLFASLSYYRAEQTGIKTLNLQSYNASLGGTYKSPAVDVTPAMSFGHLLLAETTYQRSYGPSLRLDKRLGQRLSVFATASHQRQAYSRTPVVPTADQRTGDQYYAGAGLNYALGRSLSLSASYIHTVQGALEAFNAYKRETLNLSLTKVLAQGRFAVLSLTPQLDHYFTPDTSITNRNRQDHTYRANLIVGTPLGFIASPLNAVLLTFNYEYFHARSNVPNNAYTNNKISSSLTYRLDL